MMLKNFRSVYNVICIYYVFFALLTAAVYFNYQKQIQRVNYIYTQKRGIQFLQDY